MGRPHLYPEVGERFGKLVFIKPLEPVKKGFESFATGLFQCDCGNFKESFIKYVKRNTKSCGCNYSISNKINGSIGGKKSKRGPAKK